MSQSNIGNSTTHTEVDLTPTNESKLRNWPSLIVWIAVVFAAAAIGSLATGSGLQQWYGTLNKPSFQPPNWIFGPVWSCLYLMMAVAGWNIWRQQNSNLRSEAVRTFTIVFAIQLVLNLLWSVIFFGMQMPGLAFVEILALWTAIATTIWLAFRLSKLSGWLLVPYLLWVSFASVLNFAIWRLN
jgi:tryptophan-rich sensory protein